jgi:hypothetical protein
MRTVAAVLEIRHSNVRQRSLLRIINGSAQVAPDTSSRVARMHIRPGVRLMTALLTSALLAACGGGGGGGTGGGSGAVPTPTPTSAPVNARAVIRSDGQGILAAGKVLSGGGYNAGGAPLGAMGTIRRIRARRGTLAACNSLGSLGSNTVTDTTDAQGNDTQTYTDYYDSNCQQIERVAVLVYPKGSSISGGSVNGTTTEYDHSAAVTGYSTWQSTFNSSTMTVQTQDAKTVGGAIVGRSGATCTYTGTNTETCGQASFATVGGTTTGLTESINESFAASGQNYAATAQLSATTYSGSGLTLVPPSSGTAWSLSGGTQLDSITGSGNSTYNGSFIISGSYSITDTTAGITASGTVAGATQSLTITLQQGGSTVATIVVDADGNGTITYASDGTKENVAGFTIFG